MRPREIPWNNPIGIDTSPRPAPAHPTNSRRRDCTHRNTATPKAINRFDAEHITVPSTGSSRVLHVPDPPAADADYRSLRGFALRRVRHRSWIFGQPDPDLHLVRDPFGQPLELAPTPAIQMPLSIRSATNSGAIHPSASRDRVDDDIDDPDSASRSSIELKCGRTAPSPSETTTASAGRRHAAAAPRVRPDNPWRPMGQRRRPS